MAQPEAINEIKSIRMYFYSTVAMDEWNKLYEEMVNARRQKLYDRRYKETEPPTVKMVAFFT